MSIITDHHKIPWSNYILFYNYILYLLLKNELSFPVDSVYKQTITIKHLAVYCNKDYR